MKEQIFPVGLLSVAAGFDLFKKPLFFQTITTYSMAHTVFGLFDSADHAQDAVRQLLDNGYTTDQVDLSVPIAGNTGSSTGVDPDQVTGDSIGNFFGSLFGKSDQASTYSYVARQSGSIVTVHVQTEEEAHRAACILDDMGALDVEERAAQAGYIPGSGNVDNPDRVTTAGTDESLPHTSEDGPFQAGEQSADHEGTRPRSRIVDTRLEDTIRLRQERFRQQNPFDDRTGNAAGASSDENRDLAVDHRSDVQLEPVARVMDTPHLPARMVTHVFHDRDKLERAYRFIREYGYDKDEVNVMMSDQTQQKHYADQPDSEVGEKALEGAGAGSAIGGTLGAIIGAVAAIGTSLVVPGLGLIVAGPIAAGLAGAGVGGLAGGLLGALVNSGFSEEEARDYQTAISQGGILLGVRARTEEEARHIENEWIAIDQPGPAA